MTMLRPDTAAAIGQRLLEGVNAKTLVLAVLGLAGWHYAEIGQVKDLHGEVSTLRQQTADQQVRLDIQRQAIAGKLDRDTYDRDVRTMTDSLNRIQVSIDGIHHTLEERR